MKINVIALSICGGSLVLFLAIMITYIVRIKKVKNTICSIISDEKNGDVANDSQTQRHSIPKARSSFWLVLACSVVLIMLPVIVPMETYFIAIVCCCAVFAEVIAFRDRIDQLKGNGNSSAK